MTVPAPATARSSPRLAPRATSTIAVDVVGEALDLVDGVRLAVVDDEVGAGRARQLALLVRAHRGDDAGAGVLGQLDRVVPDRPGPARDEHGPPGEGPAVAAAADEQAVRRGHGRHAEAGAQLVRRVPGQRADVRGGQHGVLGGGAVAVAEGAEEQPHALADGRGLHALAHRVDHADAVLVRDLEVLGVLPGEARAGLPVRGVHPGAGDADPDLAGAGLGGLDVLDREHLGGRTGTAVDRSLHDGPVPRNRPRYPAAASCSAPKATARVAGVWWALRPLGLGSTHSPVGPSVRSWRPATARRSPNATR